MDAVTCTAIRNLPVASQCTSNHSNWIIMIINCTGTFSLLQNTFDSCHIGCGLGLSENIPCVSLTTSLTSS